MHANHPQIILVSAAKVAARVSARKMADEVFDLLTWPDGHGADFADAFIEAMREKLPKRRIVQAEADTPQPIARLGATEMPFGVHQGKTFDDVPIEYLDWLCRSQEEFYKSLRAYLKHPELESRRG